MISARRLQKRIDSERKREEYYVTSNYSADKTEPLTKSEKQQIDNHERSKDVLVIVCFCSPFVVFMGFCFSRPAWPFCTQAQMS